jgi:feruloyl esterase
VTKTLGAQETDDFARLFMAPGMLHCGGGLAPNTFDALAALEAWVEHGTKPAQLIASRPTDGIVGRTRPLCPYPQVATYTGSGSPHAATSFVCK